MRDVRDLPARRLAHAHGSPHLLGVALVAAGGLRGQGLEARDGVRLATPGHRDARGIATRIMGSHDGMLVAAVDRGEASRGCGKQHSSRSRSGCATGGIIRKILSAGAGALRMHADEQESSHEVIRSIQS